MGGLGPRAPPWLWTEEKKILGSLMRVRVIVVLREEDTMTIRALALFPVLATLVSVAVVSCKNAHRSAQQGVAIPPAAPPTGAAFASVPSDLSIQYSFGACRGRPRERIDIDATRVGIYENPRTHESFGFTKGPDEILRLLRGIDEAGFYKLPDSSINPEVRDGDCRSLSVRQSGVEKRVWDQNSGVLSDIGRLIKSSVPPRTPSQTGPEERKPCRPPCNKSQTCRDGTCVRWHPSTEDW